MLLRDKSHGLCDAFAGSVMFISCGPRAQEGSIDAGNEEDEAWRSKQIHLWMTCGSFSVFSKIRKCVEVMVSRSGDDAWQDLEGSNAAWHLRNFAQKARDWWLETTDVVFLNSPWLRRSTGRGFRCLWILCHFVLWGHEGVPFRLLKFIESVPLWYQISKVFCFVFMLLAFGRVLWSSLMTSRDTFGNSLLLAGASMISFAFWGALKMNINDRDTLIPGQNAFMTVFLGYTFPVLCHCNVHPVVLLVLFAYTLEYTLESFQRNDDDAYEFGDLLVLPHIIGFQFFIGCAFGLDFTNRVKAVATGMLHNADTIDPLESPVAGRSSRHFCWLLLINNWVFVAFFCRLSWQDIVYPSWMYILDTICLCLPCTVLLCTRSQNCTPFKSDVVFVFCSSAPPAWVLLRHNFYQAHHESFFADYNVLAWFFGGIALACRSTFFATQAAIQAGDNNRCRNRINAGRRLLEFRVAVWVWLCNAPSGELSYLASRSSFEGVPNKPIAKQYTDGLLDPKQFWVSRLFLLSISSFHVRKIKVF